MRNQTGSPATAYKVGREGNMGGNAGTALVPIGMRAFLYYLDMLCFGLNWVAPRDISPHMLGRFFYFTFRGRCYVKKGLSNGTRSDCYS